MVEKSLKEKADQLMKIQGNIRGVIFYSHSQYILAKEGEKGLKAVEEKLKELGYPLKFKEVKKLDWYPEALSHLILVVCQEIFGWKEEDFFQMGYDAPQYSFVVKILMKYFLSIEETFKKSPKYWRKHIDFGELEPYLLNERERYVILHLKNYKFHPLGCIYKRGYFTRIVEYNLPGKKIEVRETKCVHKGDPLCEFLIRW